jgi:hypothetical protein
MPESDEKPYAEKFVTLFKAHRDGNHRFFISADCHASVFINTSGREESGKTLLLEITEGTDYQDMITLPETRSEFVNLTKGNLYYLEVHHYSHGLKGHISLGVSIPAPPEGANYVNKVPEVRRNRLWYDIARYEKHELIFPLPHTIGDFEIT